MKPKMPTKEGFFWGKWRIKAAGTVDEDEGPGDEWEVHHVVENHSEPKDPEYLMVMVPGVAKWQSLENFFWGDEVLPPAPQVVKAPGSPRYDNTSCSQCGKDFGPGDHGFSHCQHHRHKTPIYYRAPRP